jgi:hypothetical protein
MLFVAFVAFRTSCAWTDPAEKATNTANSINALVLLIFIPQTMLFSEKYKPF